MRQILMIAVFIATATCVRSQESLSPSDTVLNFPDKFFRSVEHKSSKMQKRLLKSTQSYLNKLERQEAKMQKSMAKQDSSSAIAMFGNVHERYAKLRETLHTSNEKIQKLYSPHIDSIGTALRFLNVSHGISQGTHVQQQLHGVLSNFGDIQNKLNQTEFVKQQLEIRRVFLQQKFQSFGFNKEFRKFQAEVYYYRAQLDHYKQLWEDPTKMESSLLRAIAGMPLFRSFFSKHSELAGLFQLPGNDDISVLAVNNMQTRSLISQQLGQRFGSLNGASQAIGNNISNAQSLLQPLKNQFRSFVKQGTDPSMPNFKPNEQKSRTIFQRMEFGVNVQSTKSNFFFPTTTDIGLAVGYKLSSKSVAGIGGSYKLGWGKDIRHIALTHEGVGLRTFADVKLKGNFWFSAGGEMNYKSAFRHYDELKNKSAWQRSALGGVTKKYKVKKYTGELKFLYDFLWKAQSPATQPFVFRTGYTF